MKLRTPILGGALALATTLAPHTGLASSHREAPFIALNPKVDATDFYVFNSYESGRTGYVTLLANYQGLQDAYGGPNYFNMDPDAIYEIHIDNTGDGVEDVTFQFDFDLALAGSPDTGTTLDIGPTGNTKAVSIPFATLGPVGAGNETLRNVLETYKVNVIRGPRRTGAVSPVMDTAGKSVFGKPIDNAGPKTIADYTTYANSFIRQFDMPGCTPTGVTAGTHGKIFVGQRKDGFAVNLGQIFDLIDMNPKANNGTPPTANAAFANILGAQDQNFNTLTDKNVTTIAIEVPASCLTATGNTNIGAWTTASVRQARVINPTGTFTTPAKQGGPWVQVSRLGLPLVNEVVIGLKDKNKFNNSEPKDDGANFATYITNPTLPHVVALLFGDVGVMEPKVFPRADLVQVFATGIPGVNAISTTPTVAEMVRLNTTTTTIFAPRTAATQSPYGAAGCYTAGTATAPTLDPTLPSCDASGFPNGRRPGDDVVDVAIRAAMGRLLSTTDAPAGQLAYVDGAAANAPAFDSSFPYLKAPLPGAP